MYKCILVLMIRSIDFNDKFRLYKIKENTKRGVQNVLCMEGCFNGSYPKSKTRRGRVQNNGTICPTSTTENCEIYIIEPIKR